MAQQFADFAHTECQPSQTALGNREKQNATRAKVPDVAFTATIFYWYWGGDEGTRTLDPHIANVVLSQLSYIPKCKKVYHADQGSARVSGRRYASSHSAAHHSAWGIPFARVTCFSVATAKGTRRRSTLRLFPVVDRIAYSPHGGLRTEASDDGTRS